MTEPISTEWLLGILSTIIIGGFGVVFLFVNYKYKKKSDVKADDKEVLKMALQEAKNVKQEQRNLAMELKSNQAEIAKAVKEETHEYVKNSLTMVRNELETEVKLAYARMELIEGRVDHNSDIIKRLEATHRDAMERIDKSIYFLQQFQWGRDAKSIAPYTIGETESIEHSEAEDAGIFRPTQEEEDEKKTDE